MTSRSSIMSTTSPDHDVIIESTTSCTDGNMTSSSFRGMTSYSFYRVIVDVYVVTALCVAGLLGNLLSIVVLHRDRDKPNTTNWLLQTLAFVDTIYLATCVLIQPIKAVHDFTDWFDEKSLLRQIYPYVEPHAWGAASIAQTMTVWIVMLVTADRYIAVCRPLQMNWRSLTRAKFTVGVVFAAAVVYNLPRFFEREVITTVVACTSVASVQTRKTALRTNRNYFLIYKTVCYFVFRSVGPLVTLVLLNVELVRATRAIHLRHRHLTQKIKHRENLTAMLVTVVTVFIVCQLPDLGIRVAYTCAEFASSPSSDVVLDVTALRYANAASNALLTLNSAVNFLVYCLVGRKFRRILLNEVCRARGDPLSLGHLHPVDVSEAGRTQHHCHRQRLVFIPEWSAAGGSIDGDAHRGRSLVCVENALPPKCTDSTRMQSIN